MNPKLSICRYNHPTNPKVWCGNCGEWKPKEPKCPECGLVMRQHSRKRKKDMVRY